MDKNTEKLLANIKYHNSECEGYFIVQASMYMLNVNNLIQSEDVIKELIGMINIEKVLEEKDCHNIQLIRLIKRNGGANKFCLTILKRLKQSKDHSSKKLLINFFNYLIRINFLRKNEQTIIYYFNFIETVAFDDNEALQLRSLSIMTLIENLNEEAAIKFYKDEAIEIRLRMTTFDVGCLGEKVVNKLSKDKSSSVRIQMAKKGISIGFDNILPLCTDSNTEVCRIALHECSLIKWFNYNTHIDYAIINLSKNTNYLKHNFEINDIIELVNRYHFLLALRKIYFNIFLYNDDQELKNIAQDNIVALDEGKSRFKFREYDEYYTSRIKFKVFEQGILNIKKYAKIPPGLERITKLFNN